MESANNNTQNAAGSRRATISTAVLVPFILTILCAIATIIVITILKNPQRDVQSRFTLYLETLKPQSMLVAATATERYAASKEFTAKLLALLQIRAKIRLSALADITYVIPADNPSLWHVVWDAKTRALTIKTPPATCLLPAVHTETIEIVSENANLLTNTIFRLKEEAAKMKEVLSEDLLQHAKARLQTPEVQSAIEQGIQTFALAFCKAAGVGTPATITIRVQSPEDGFNAGFLK